MVAPRAEANAAGAAEVGPPANALAEMLAKRAAPSVIPPPPASAAAAASTGAGGSGGSGGSGGATIVRFKKQPRRKYRNNSVIQRIDQLPF